jgi:hypothetical protein
MNAVVLRTYPTGRLVHPLDPREDEISIVDIAWSLSNINRYNGYTHLPYSVGQHSVHVAMCLPERLRLLGLLHDASEAYLGDVTAPIKKYLGGYEQYEKNMMSTIYTKFGLMPSYNEFAAVHMIDQKIRISEQHALTRHPVDVNQGLNIRIRPWGQQKSYITFLLVFHKYYSQVN